MSNDIDGICPDCKEWTNLSQTCCGAGVYAEGSFHSEPEEEPAPDAVAGLLSALADPWAWSKLEAK